MMRLPLKGVLTVGALGLLLGGGFALFQMYRGNSPTTSPRERALYSTWKERIATDGGPAAYEAFRASVANESANTQFFDARVFGRALYDAIGNAGIETCGEEFRYACQHGFVARAILADGADAAQELNTWCLAKGRFAKQCQHGLGHGLVAHFGYTEAALTKSLNACEALPESVYADSISGCMWGAYMEYYTRYWEHLARAPRNADTDAPLALCEGMDGVPAASCGFATVQWLLDEDTSRDQNERFTSLGNDCRTSVHTLVRTGCFLGTGSQAVQAVGFDAEKTHALCSVVADGDAADSKTCERGAQEQYRSATIAAPSECWVKTLSGSTHLTCDAAPTIGNTVTE